MTDSIKHVDFLGDEIKIGDHIVFVELNYRNFKIGKLVRFTPKFVWIETTTHYCKDRIIEVKQRPDQVIKISDKEAFIHII